jgi:hypothetical protein
MTALTDRELLELAAKAAGLHDLGEWREEEGCWYYPFRSPLTNMHLWNPLTDDGDALRLAMALAMKHPGASFDVCISSMHDGRGFASAEFFSRDGRGNSVVDADLSSATRRAIVRAAAAIGQAQEASVTLPPDNAA